MSLQQLEERRSLTPLGTQSARELARLLKHGYFVYGDQRIVNVPLRHRPSSARRAYRLWESWDARVWHLSAIDSVSVLINMANIPIETWFYVYQELLEDFFIL